ncbi:MAG: hypothetical protein AB7H86_14145 [Blastocatellales bacterium]|nr:hypothetical protein [Nitrosomonas nitrosa]
MRDQPSALRRRFSQFGQWSIGLYIYNNFNRFYDLVLYAAVIAKLGAIRGGAVMMALSFFVDLVSLRLYDRFKRDLFGIEELKRVRDSNATTWTGSMLRWALRQNELAVFVTLTLISNPFVVTAWLRHGAGEFNGMQRRDWTIFLSSVALGNLYWIAVVSGGIRLFRTLFSIGCQLIPIS